MRESFQLFSLVVVVVVGASQTTHFWNNEWCDMWNVAWLSNGEDTTPEREANLATYVETETDLGILARLEPPQRLSTAESGILLP